MDMDCGGMTCLPDRQAPLFLHAPPTVSAFELSNTLEPISTAQPKRGHFCV